jgi:HSP20 family protein
MRTLMPILRPARLFGWPDNTIADRFFGEFAPRRYEENEKTWVPRIDVSENETAFTVKAEVPGMDKKDLDITLTDGLLTIKGEKKHGRDVEEENYHLIESSYGSFSRTLKLPVDVDTSRVDAKYKDGVLTVVLPKAEEAVPRKIEVTSEE